MSETQNPEMHINEEPRNDFIDVAVGFAAMTGVILLFAVIATIVSLLIGDGMYGADTLQ